jgi:HTH-type transcriptional regulator/antitoxin HipB
MKHQLVTNENQLLRILSVRRRALDISQADLAAKLGMSQRSISAIELGTRALSVDRLLEILNVLKLDIAVQERGSAEKAEW